MNFQFEILKYKINDLVLTDIFHDKEVILFGANGYAEFIIEHMKENGINIQAIFDNNKKKQGMSIGGVTVKAPFSKAESQRCVVVIASAYYEAMLEQLISLNYKKENIINLLEGRNDFDVDLLDDNYFHHEINMCLRGEEIRDTILEQSQTQTNIYLAPVPSIGDVYLLCLYFGEYLSENGIEDYILAIPGNSGYHLAKAFGYKHIVKLSEEEAQMLIKYRLLMGVKNSKIYVLHCGYMHIRIPCYMLMYREKTWIENYRQVLFHLKSDKKNFPVFNRVPELYWKGLEIDGEFKEEKTVVLSPYARTLAALPERFWKDLSKKLVSMGFSVYTNVLPDEQEIEGTKRLEFPLEYAVEILEKAGFFVGLRSGLCDIISNASCKKIILYTKEIFETVKVIDFYSLNKMGLCNDAVEIEVSYHIEDDVERVLVNL